jgi:hypothetical protein
VWTAGLDPLFVKAGRADLMLASGYMLPTTQLAWVRRVLTALLCLAAIAVIWYGAGLPFDHDPSAETGALIE